ncbi:MAG: flagellar motor switch protein FliN [Myxococcales bacterium FL481]|nr:MAG: flagellar motor switch protein FliN [Myxococcales bacterium FL481]
MSEQPDDLSLVLDIPVQVSVELGKRTIPIAEILALGPGSVVELGKAAGESLDVLVNGKLIARGEAVVMGEKYGVRITEVVSSALDTKNLFGAAANGGASGGENAA